MVFSDIFFIYFFLPICFALYFATKNITARNMVLLVFSLIFYTWCEPVCILLLLTTATIDFFNGKFIHKNLNSKKATYGLIFSLCVNLGLLTVFKYSDFLVANFNGIFQTNIPLPEIALPIGISFYTFQSITYIVDVYKGKVPAQEKYSNYLLYLSMFFQLVAGPIVRYSTIQNEISTRKTTMHMFESGLTRFIFGLSKKVIIANCVGDIANTLLGGDSIATASVFGAWFGVIMFSLQIYFDFSGYSDMAIGMGLMCGFKFLENFNYPYIAKSVTDFWRRWHISLGSFFREYLYIPLGGNRKNKFANLAIVWFATGLWHGASWNFTIWGLYFGLLIIAEKYLFKDKLSSIPPVISHIYLLFTVIISWSIFYFTDLGQLGTCLKTMFGFGNTGLIDEVSKSLLYNHIYLIIVAILLCTPIYPKITQKILELEQRKTAVVYSYRIVKILLLLSLLIISSLLLVGQTYNPFLYYRF